MEDHNKTIQGEHVIQAKDLCVGYDGQAVVSDIAFTVDAGRILTLVGPNGCGKSTLLKSITRQLEIVSGTIYLENRSMLGMKESDVAKKMSILMTERVRPELMTCRDIVSTGRYPYTGRLGILSEYDWKCVEDAMKLVQVWDLRDRPFGNISDGQSQRIMLARAICQEPEILIMDEPTSFLDISHKLELLAILKDLVQEKKLAVVLSLHELDLAQKISDTVLCINHGVVERAGPPEEVFTSEYIKELYGIENGGYLYQFGSLELASRHGEAEAFVIAGGGKGIPVFRRLQKLGIPFVTGVIHENDLDFPVAEILAEEVITEKAFEPVGQEALSEARAAMARCKKVICALEPEDFGTMNKEVRQLLEHARKEGKLEVLS